MRPSHLGAFVVALASVMSACGGGSPMQPFDTGNGGTGTGGPGSGGTDVTVKTSPSFSKDIYPDFVSAGCTSVGCHGSGRGGLYMRSVAEAYANLVNVTSPNSGEVLVLPGDPQASYLVKKLENRQSVGLLMPFGGPPLSQNEIQNVRNWIARGALNN